MKAIKVFIHPNRATAERIARRASRRFVPRHAPGARARLDSVLREIDARRP